MNTNDEKNLFYYRLINFIIWVILLFCIIIRCFTFTILDNQYIWIINYIGMALAIINLLIDKLFTLDKNNNSKYVPFVGLIVLTIIILIIVCLFVYLFQKNKYAQSLNDIITLLALFFSLSKSCWDKILNAIIKII
ncbi:MAG: hypothetical protein ACLUVX_08715 [Lachnospira pectinoschiza]